MSQIVTLTGRLICADEGEAAIVRAALPLHERLTRAEPGNLRFDVVPAGPLEWTVAEAFVDAAAFRHHQARAAASDWGRATAGIRRDYAVTGPAGEAEVRVGVGGWTFAPWRETFYPEGLRQADELGHMADRLNAVEVNGTFYRTQTPETFRAWFAATPPDFRFGLKAPRYATNRTRLAEAGDSIARFTASGIAELGDKLGPINWQFAPTKRFDPDDFARFLDLLPQTAGGVPLGHAVEVRHESFLDPAFPRICAERGVAIVLAGDSAHPVIDEATAPFAYLRLMGTQPRYRKGYAPSALGAWGARIARMADQRPVWAFVISGEKRLNPLAAEALLKLLRRG